MKRKLSDWSFQRILVAASIMAMPVFAGAATSTVWIFPGDVGPPIPGTTVALPGPTNHQSVSGANYTADVEVSIPDIHMKLTTGFLPTFGPSVFATGRFQDTWTTTAPSVAFSWTPQILQVAFSVGDGSSCSGGSSSCAVVPGVGGSLGVGYVQIGISLTGFTNTMFPGSAVPDAFARAEYTFKAGNGPQAHIVNPHLGTFRLPFLTYQFPVMPGAAFGVDSLLTGQVCCGGELDFSNTASIEWIALPEGWTISAPGGVLANVPIYTMAAVVPEPTQWLLLLAGLVAVAARSKVKPSSLMTRA